MFTKARRDVDAQCMGTPPAWLVNINFQVFGRRRKIIVVITEYLSPHRVLDLPDGSFAGEDRFREAEPGEEFLVNGGQQIAVSLGQLDFLHREVGVEISHV